MCLSAQWLFFGVCSLHFFILLCLTSCEYEKPITPDKEFMKLGISLPPNYETRATIDTIKWQKE